MKKILYLIRHGQTLFNVRHKVQGWCDSPLSELGIKQALIAKNYFLDNGIKFSDAYCSTSERASDTLEIICDQEYTRVKGLKEWNFGVFEGESEDLNPPLPYRDFFVKYGGEEEMAFRHRISDTLTNIMKQIGHEQVIALSHGAACAQFARHWAHTSEVVQKERIGNCCILKFEFENDEFRLLEIINHNFENI